MSNSETPNHAAGQDNESQEESASEHDIRPHPSDRRVLPRSMIRHSTKPELDRKTGGSQSGNSSESTNKSQKSSKKVEAFVETIDKKIALAEKQIAKIQKKKEILLTEYLQKHERAGITTSTNVNEQFYKTYTTKNLKYTQASERLKTKIENLQNEKTKVLATGSVGQLDYLKEVSYQKLNEGALSFRNRLVNAMSNKNDDLVISKDDSLTRHGRSPVETIDDVKGVTTEKLKTHINTMFRTHSLRSSESDSINHPITPNNPVGSNQNLAVGTSLTPGVEIESRIFNENMHKTLIVLTEMVERIDERIELIEHRLALAENVDARMEEALDRQMEKIDAKLQYPIQQNYKTNEILTEMSKSIESLDERLILVERDLKDPNRTLVGDEASRGKIAFAKLANVVIQIISSIVMLVSSFADVIIDLDKRVKLVLLFAFVSYALARTFEPIFQTIFT